MNEETKTIKISKPVHKKMKTFLATNEEGITSFADRAIVNQIKSDKVTKRIMKNKTEEK